MAAFDLHRSIQGRVSVARNASHFAAFRLEGETSFQEQQ